MIQFLLTYLPFLISFLIGYFVIVLCSGTKKRLGRAEHCFMAGGLGLGVSAQITFFNFVLFGHLNRPFVIGMNLALLTGLFLTSLLMHGWKISALFPAGKQDPKSVLPYLGLAALAYPLWDHGQFYAYGGWDAWSVWNLKSKMLFLSESGWQVMFDPLLWRSSPHYPLLLPLMNTWGWVFLDNPDFQVPAFTAFVFGFSTAGLLLSGLLRITKSYYAVLGAAALITSPLFVKLSLSQYADIVVAYYLLCGLMCLLQVKTDNSRTHAILGGISVGFLSFAKGEGLLAAGIILLLAVFYLMWKNKPDWKTVFSFYAAAAVASLSTVIFTLFFAPENQTFINGLNSTTNPIAAFRFKAVGMFYLVELVSGHWNGLWIVLIAGLVLSLGKCFNRNSIIFPAFLLGYIGVITAFYLINTYYDSSRILWWLQVSLSRLMYATLPVVVFWVFFSLWETPEKK